MMLYLPGDEGQALVEYSLILVSVFVLALVALGLVGVNVFGLFSRVLEALKKILGG